MRAPPRPVPPPGIVALLSHESRLLRRYRIVVAAIVVALLWLAVLVAVPAHTRALTLALVLVAEATTVGVFFLAGLDLFERDERTELALAVAPVTARSRLLVRIGLLSALGVAVAVVLVVSAWGLGLPARPLLLPIAVAVATISVLNLLVGRLVVQRVRSITDYVIAVQAPLLPLALPLLDLLGWVRSPWWWVLPSHGPMRLLTDGVHGTWPSPITLVAAVLLPTTWALGLGALALRQGAASS